MSRFPPGTLIAVTGANGYIGSHIVRVLLEKGWKVRAVVRDPGNPAKVAHLKALPHAAELLEFAKGELSEDDYVKAFAGCRAVIHAASPYIYTAEDPDRDIVQPAIKGTLAALKAAVVNQVSRVVVTSSTAAVTHFPVPDGYKFSDKDWNMNATLANGPYLLSKRLAEQAAWDFAKAHEKEIDLTVINPCYVLGPSISGDNNINTSLTNLRHLLLGEPGPIPLDSYRPVADVRDVATAHWIALNNPASSGKRLIVCNKVVAWSELAALLKRLYPQYPNTVPLEMKPAPWSIDTQLLTELGLLKYIDVEQMMKDCVDSMIAQNLLPKK